MYSRGFAWLEATIEASRHMHVCTVRTYVHTYASYVLYSTIHDSRFVRYTNVSQLNARVIHPPGWRLRGEGVWSCAPAAPTWPTPGKGGEAPPVVPASTRPWRSGALPEVSPLSRGGAPGGDPHVLLCLAGALFPNVCRTQPRRTRLFLLVPPLHSACSPPSCPPHPELACDAHTLCLSRRLRRLPSASAPRPHHSSLYERTHFAPADRSRSSGTAGTTLAAGAGDLATATFHIPDGNQSAMQPLHCAADAGQLWAVKTLLRAGAAVTHVRHAATPPCALRLLVVTWAPFGLSWARVRMLT